jgi:GPH family glycoside/pentoside/hexuronide:cation symporter
MTQSRGALLGYSMLACPLAMAALPIYVHLPKFYASNLGVPIAWIGLILFAARLLDAIQDPVLGYLSDRTADGRWGRRPLIVLGVPLLAIGMVGLFQPPVAGQVPLSLWLAATLVIVYVGFSAASITYLAMGAELTTDYHERTRVTAFRGALGIVGVLLAATLPELLSRGSDGQGLVRFSQIFIPVLLVCSLLTLKFTPLRPRTQSRTAASWRAMFAPFRHLEYRWLLAVSIPSGIAAAIPATLILFFVEDVLRAPSYSGMFLAVYFLSGALTLPAWVALSRRIGKKNAWLIGMIMAVVAFVWAYALGPGDIVSFAVVCVLSGLAFGAELALPPSILADLVDQGSGNGDHKAHGAYFGLWQMIEKFNLAAAAGIALPLLAFLGYQPDTLDRNPVALSATYALLPCAIKLLAAAMLWVAPFDRIQNPSHELVTERGLS